MSLECINPEGLPVSEHFSHVVVAKGSRMVFIAGQVSEDSDGNTVAVGDMAAQSKQVFANIGRALAAAGARPEQVAKLTIFVSNYRREH
ncbi:RidA family protein, partial [Tabrizicola sp.]|uniref:RidA family protein n=1 Tax=Tabrizicola sp. TaxID=2005166 RepID=UPI003F366412